jgi:hypothetical protein
MKRNIKTAIIAFMAFVASSCSYIDIVPDGIPDIETHAFAMRSQAEKFLFTCYSYIPQTGNPSRTPSFLAGHEIVITSVSRSYSGNNAYYIQRGQQRSTNPYLDFWGGVYGGNSLWRAINDCNIFLDHVHEVPDMNEIEKSMWEAEVEVLKVYYHFWLVRMYGPVPIADKSIAVSASEDEVKVYRNTLDECFDYMLNKLDTVISRGTDGFGLAEDWLGFEGERTGRISKGIALFLRAQIAVWAASPLYNGNSLYSGITDSRGVDIFSSSKSADQKLQRWTAAEHYCDEALQLLDSKHRLHVFTPSLNPSDGQDVLEPGTVQKLTIRTAITEPFNSEIIWSNTNNWIGVSGFGYNDVQNQSHPRDLNASRKVANSNHRGNFAVPLKIARQFYTKYGLPISFDKAWLNTNIYEVVETRPADSIHCFLYEAYSTIQFNRNREIRYYAALGFDAGVWYGQGDISDHGQYLSARQGGAAANTIDNSWNLTGLFPKKLLHYKTVFAGSDGTTTTSATAERYPWALMRLNDLILMYAEALNETGKRAEAKVQLNRIRTRAYLPDIDEAYQLYSTTPGRVNSQQGLREIIREERLNELALEGYRYWDLLRWLMAADDLSQPITGWTLSGKEPAAYYKEAIVSAAPSSFVSPRDYFSPIPSADILRNRNLMQNPGW